jgi:fatty acid/phospholipid biosynthesis enzyme
MFKIKIDMENKFIKISVDALGSETSVENIIKGLNTSFLRNENYFFRIFGPRRN